MYTVCKQSEPNRIDNMCKCVLDTCDSCKVRASLAVKPHYDGIA